MQVPRRIDGDSCASRKREERATRWQKRTQLITWARAGQNRREALVAALTAADADKPSSDFWAEITLMAEEALGGGRKGE
eukprot:893393-Alexandrium_andersonii.AAC.1